MRRLVRPLWLVAAIAVSAGQHYDVSDSDSGSGISSRDQELAVRRQEAFEKLHTKLQRLAQMAALSQEREGEAESSGGESMDKVAPELFWGETEAINLQMALNTRSPEEASRYGSWSSNWAMR